MYDFMSTLSQYNKDKIINNNNINNMNNYYLYSEIKVFYNQEIQKELQNVWIKLYQYSVQWMKNK